MKVIEKISMRKVSKFLNPFNSPIDFALIDRQKLHYSIKFK